MNYKTAYRRKQRLFYEDYSATIRSCPENYCIATKSSGKWKLYNDGAVTKWFLFKLLLNIPLLPINRLLY